MLRVAFIGDLEPKPCAEFPHANATVEYINQLRANDAVDFVIGIGDVAHKGTELQYEEATKVLKKLNVPFYTIMENEEHGSTVERYMEFAKQWNPNLSSPNNILNHEKLPFGLYITNSVQEEVGLRGAEMITRSIKPNIAIVTDVCHDSTTPMIDKKIEGETKIGSGSVITYAPAVQNNLRDLIIVTAEKNSIPFQRLASSRVTGTDTDAFAYSNGGVASALISLPLRYMHTTVEMVHRNDVENVIKLIYETLLNIENNHDFNYFK